MRWSTPCLDQLRMPSWAHPIHIAVAGGPDKVASVVPRQVSTISVEVCAEEGYDKEAEDSCLPDNEADHVESQLSTNSWMLASFASRTSS